MKSKLISALYFSFTMSFAVAGPYTKADYQSNPVFVGEWKDRTAMVERTFRIIRNDAVRNDYNYGIYMKTKFLESGNTSGFQPTYVGSLQGNALKVRTEKGSTNTFYILKDGRLTDNDIYLMQKVK